MLGAIESLMSAMVADKMSGDRHNSNMELVAQGVANIVSPMVGGLPATGAIARTATNIRSGAKTPVAGIVHALTLLVILLVAAPLAGAIPDGGARGHPDGRVLQHGRVARDSGAAAPDARRTSPCGSSTFALTVFADLTVAVEVGMMLAALLFIRTRRGDDDGRRRDRRVHRGQPHHSLHRLNIPPYVRDLPHPRPVPVRRDRQAATSSPTALDALPEIVVLRLRNMTAIDATGLRAFEDLADRLQRVGTRRCCCAARGSSRRT